MLLGHVDVVPPGDPGSWTSGPFAPEVIDGLLYGRGACDMKGGLVSMIEAVRLVEESGAELSGEIVVVSVPAEEDGGAGTFAALQAGVSADMAVIPEPTTLHLVIAHAGAITFTLRVPGKAAHASMRREGVSALDKLFILLQALREDEQARNESERHPLMRAIGLPYPTVVGVVEGGSWASTVRLGQTGEEAAEDLRRAIAAAWEADDWLSGFPVGLEIWGGSFDSAFVDPDGALPTELAAAHGVVTGSAAEMVGAPYGADMRLLVNGAGIPTVMYGPGDVRLAHSADECVPLGEVATCAEVLATWLAG
jgi:acetylornithine deacetylase